jgi:predicted methyltransferase
MRGKNMSKAYKFVLVLGFILVGFNPIVTEAQEDPGHRVMSEEDKALLAQIIDGDHRPEFRKARDRYRRPWQTLNFFGIRKNDTVVEIWPGEQGGWYREILEPFYYGHGNYIPVRSSSSFPDIVDSVPYGEVDMIFVFRAHGFMIFQQPAQQYVDALFEMLTPGGILAIVDHAGDEAIPQDPEGENGYVNESYFRMMAENAGFVLLAESQHNRNELDDKDHPCGVWSLPPTLRGTSQGSSEQQVYIDIGESDRFSLKFYKPK